MRVAVLGGGRSSEHEVSLASAEAVRAGLLAGGHEPVDVRIARDGRWSRDGDRLALEPGDGLLGEHDDVHGAGVRRTGRRRGGGAAVFRPS